MGGSCPNLFGLMRGKPSSLTLALLKTERSLTPHSSELRSATFPPTGEGFQVNNLLPNSLAARGAPKREVKENQIMKKAENNLDNSLLFITKSLFYTKAPARRQPASRAGTIFFLNAKLLNCGMAEKHPQTLTQRPAVAGAPYLLHVAGTNISSSGKTSSRPNSMSIISTDFESTPKPP